MNLKISKYALIFTSIIALIYHFLIITQVIGYVNIWGGQLQSIEQMYVFESFSIAVQTILLIIILRFDLKQVKRKKFWKYFFLTFTFLMLLNTVGNIFAKSNIERYLFTVITLLNSGLFYNYFRKISDLKE